MFKSVNLVKSTSYKYELLKVSLYPELESLVVRYFKIFLHLRKAQNFNSSRPNFFSIL